MSLSSNVKTLVSYLYVRIIVQLHRSQIVELHIKRSTSLTLFTQYGCKHPQTAIKLTFHPITNYCFISSPLCWRIVVFLDIYVSNSKIVEVGLVVAVMVL